MTRVVLPIASRAERSEVTSGNIFNHYVIDQNDNIPIFRRRYTDSRHPTTELPDVRGGIPDLPSVRDPPVRNKSKSKEVLEDGSGTVLDSEGEQKRSPNIADRPSYKRWQMSAKNNDSDSPS